MNGNSYEDCKKIAEEINTKLKPFITEHGSMPWKQLSEEVDHDELVYKLVLKYLRRDGFDIGNMDNPQITLSSN
jgi:hydroxymethylpyrimidine pyrophosphatase-like HAD family hydrolase|tara:strand:+ start:799 stop:1020 length:222 start_codon:yes stop_codon:yes gene_type:complete